MRAKITRPYTYAVNGYNLTVFQIGEIVEGRIAEKAVKAGHAAALFPEIETPEPMTIESKVDGPAEFKRGRGRPRKAEQ